MKNIIIATTFIVSTLLFNAPPTFHAEQNPPITPIQTAEQNPPITPSPYNA